MTIALTGATGQLGRLAVDHLVARGVAPAEIVAVGRSAERLVGFADGVRTAVAPYEDPAALQEAFAGADAVVLISGSENGSRVPQHRNAIDAAVAAGVPLIVYTSAPHADDTVLGLAAEHRVTEEMLAAADLEAIVLRNNWYTENYLGALEQARATGTLLSSAGDGRVASASRTDYAEAIAVVLTSDGHAGATYELAGDTAWTFEELAQAIAEAIGSDVTYTPLDGDAHRAALLAAGLDEGTAAFVVGLDADIRAGALADTGGGTLSRLIGRPTTPLVEGLRAGTA